MSAFISGTTGNTDSSSTTSHSIDLPSGAVVGDKIIIAIGIDSAGTAYTTPAGWTAHFLDEDVDGDGTAAVFSKDYEGGDSWPLTIETDTSERCSWMVQAIRDCGTLDGISATVNVGTGTTATIPDYTTGADDCLVFAIVVTDKVSGTHSAISGYSNLEYASGTSAASVSIQSKLVASAGTTETGNTVTWSTSEQWAAMVVSFGPGTTVLQAAGDVRSGARLGGSAILESTYYPTGGVREGVRLGGAPTLSTDFYPAGGLRAGVRLGGVALALTEHAASGGLRSGVRLAGRAVAYTTTDDTSRHAAAARMAGSFNTVVIPAAPRLAGAKLDNGL